MHKFIGGLWNASNEALGPYGHVQVFAYITTMIKDI